jgi:hypothetical protein
MLYSDRLHANGSASCLFASANEKGLCKTMNIRTSSRLTEQPKSLNFRSISRVQERSGGGARKVCYGLQRNFSVGQTCPTCCEVARLRSCNDNSNSACAAASLHIALLGPDKLQIGMLDCDILTVHCSAEHHNAGATGSGKPSASRDGASERQSYRSANCLACGTGHNIVNFFARNPGYASIGPSIDREGRERRRPRAPGGWAQLAPWLRGIKMPIRYMDSLMYSQWQNYLHC